VIPKPAIVAVYIVVAVSGLSVSASKAVAQQPQHYSRSELRNLMKNAKSPEDYLKLARYSRYKEQLYRVKAEAEMDDYAHCARNVMLVPKFPTRPDVTQKMYEYYSYEADKNATLAAQYEGLLIANGLRLPNRFTVSLGSLEKANGLQPRADFRQEHSPLK